MKEGYVKIEQKKNHVAIIFHHPKSNSLPGYLLEELENSIKKASAEKTHNVIILQSEGEKAFCAGASFDELLALTNFEDAKKFFLGFAKVINAMRKSPKFVVARVHSKIVGGGVGITAASDYALACKNSSLKLSELTLSIGPFVIGPAVERKIGKGEYQNLTIDSQWRSADWGYQKGLYAKVVDSEEELDNEISSLTERLSKLNPETIRDMKKCFWEGTENWDELLEERAEISARLVLTDFTKNYIRNFIKERK